MKKICLIGFNKCGTSSFHYLFKKNNISSIHWGGNDPNKNIALQVFKNMTIHRDPFFGIERYYAYGDISFVDDHIYIEGCRFFREFHRYHPDWYYILNVRPLESWLISRFNHGGGSLARKSMSVFSCDENELKKIWRNQFLGHTLDVKEYFSSQNGNLLIFNIENDHPKNIRDFLVEFDLDITHWGKKNESKIIDSF